MAPRTARWVAWSIVIVYVILATVGLSLQVLTNTSFANMGIPVLVVLTLVAGVWPVIGALIVTHYPRHPVGWLLCSGLSVLAVDLFVSGYVFYDMNAHPGSLPGVDLALVWLNWTGMPFAITAFTLMILLFPDGRPKSPRWHKVGWTAAGALFLYVPLKALEPGPIDLFLYPFLINPLGVSVSLWAYLNPLRWMAVSIITLCNLAAVISLISRLRRTQGDERQQVKWLVLPAVVFWTGIPFGFLSEYDPSGVLTGITVTLHVTAAPGMVIATAIAIFKYRLYDIDIIINRTLVYGTLTASVVGLYVLVVGGAGVVFQTGSNLASLLLATLLVAILFKPLYIRLQASIDHLMYRAAGPGHEVPPVKPPTAGVQTSEETIAHSSPTLPIFLSGRRLILARLAWVVLVVLAIALWIIGSFAYANEPPPSCAEVECDPFEVSAEDLEIVQDLHLPLGLIVGFWTVTNIGFGLGFFAIAGLIFWRKSNDWLALLVSFTLIFLGAVLFTDSDDTLWRTYAELRLPLAIVYTLGFTALMLLFFYFPDGRFVPRWRPARIAVLLVILLTTPFFTTAARAVTVGTLLSVGTACLGLAAQIYRYRRISGPVQRQQTKWVVLGLVASIAVMVIWVLIGASFPPDRPGPARLYALLFTRPVISILIPLLPLTIAFSILRYRLWDIDLVINRALVFGALTALIVALYVLVVGVFGALFQMSGNLLISLVATGLAAILFQPLRDRLQGAVNRLMYGERDNPVAVLSKLGERLEATMSPDTVLPTLVETVAQALKLPYVAIELRQGDHFEMAALYGLPATDVIRLPLVYQGDTIGHLLAAPRSPGETFSPADMKLLENIAYQAGTAVHAIQLTAALQHSRQQLVTAREEERRRLRRDLHDGLGPQLASQMLTIDAIGKLLERDPTRAGELLQALKQQSQVAIGDIRRVVHDLRPPVLDDLGLVAALRDVTRSYQPGDLRITIDAPERLPALPAAVEVAAYRIVQEALTNVIRHAQACTCHIQLSIGDSSELCLEIEDDGRGLSANHRAGVGCQSMRERASELGGEFVLEAPAGGGTRLYARLPLLAEET